MNFSTVAHLANLRLPLDLFGFECRLIMRAKWGKLKLTIYPWKMWFLKILPNLGILWDAWLALAVVARGEREEKKIQREKERVWAREIKDREGEENSREGLLFASAGEEGSSGKERGGGVRDHVSSSYLGLFQFFFFRVMKFWVCPSFIMWKPHLAPKKNMILHFLYLKKFHHWNLKCGTSTNQTNRNIPLLKIPPTPFTSIILKANQVAYVSRYLMNHKLSNSKFHYLLGRST